MRKLLVFVLLGGLLAASALPLFAEGKSEASQPAGAQPIKLGGVWPLGDITGIESSNAAKLAVKEINASGGVLGRPLRLIVVDDQMKPETGAAALEQLATVDKVDIFVGGLLSNVALAQAPILKKYGKVTLYTGGAAGVFEKAIGADSDWFFHLHPWDYEQGASYIEGWKAIAAQYPQVKLGRWFMAYEEGPFGSASFQASKPMYAATGGSMTGESFKSAAFGGGNYSAVLLHAKQANPDAFIWAGYAADALPIMQQAKAIGFAPPLFIGAPPGWPADFGKSPLANDVIAYGMWAPSIANISPVSKHFFDAYVKEYGTEPVTYFAALAYSAIYILKDAIQRAGTIDESALISALEATKYKSPLGETITFTPSNVIKHQGIKEQKILQWQNGQQQVIWPFQYKTADLVYPFPGWDGR